MVRPRRHVRVDFYRRAAGFVAVGVLGVLAGPAARADSIFNIVCGGVVHAQVVPVKEKTVLYDMMSEKRAQFATLPFSESRKYVMYDHVPRIRLEMQKRGLDTGCEAGVQLVELSGPWTDDVIAEAQARNPVQRPSESVDSPVWLRNNETWDHASVVELVQRGQMVLIDADDARLYDPAWPGDRRVIGAVLFLLPKEGVLPGKTTVFRWNRHEALFRRVADTPHITKENFHDPAITGQLLAYCGENMPVPARISVGDLAVDLNPNERYYTSTRDCGRDDPTHDELVACADRGDAILLTSATAVHFDPAFTDRKVVGALVCRLRDHGALINVWDPAESKYRAIQPSLGGNGIPSGDLYRLDVQNLVLSYLRSNLIVVVDPMKDKPESFATAELPQTLDHGSAAALLKTNDRTHILTVDRDAATHGADAYFEPAAIGLMNFDIEAKLTRVWNYEADSGLYRIARVIPFAADTDSTDAAVIAALKLPKNTAVSRTTAVRDVFVATNQAATQTAPVPPSTPSRAAAASIDITNTLRGWAAPLWPYRRWILGVVGFVIFIRMFRSWRRNAWLRRERRRLSELSDINDFVEDHMREARRVERIVKNHAEELMK